VTGGDDVFPDPRKRAEEIEAEFIEHFHGTLGVMQPVGGKPWSPKLDAGGRNVVQRCAWSPWLGREWCKRSFGGQGPEWSEFWHYQGDAYLQIVAERLGLFWQRWDLSQEHENWKVVQRHRPDFLQRAKVKNDDDVVLMAKLIANGLPGSGLLPV
jgi:hypothetical protein